MFLILKLKYVIFNLIGLYFILSISRIFTHFIYKAACPLFLYSTWV